MNILDEIILYKREEVRKKSELVSVTELEKSAYFSKPVLSFKEFILDPSKTSIIAEFKKKSPSKGLINGDADIVKVSADYVKHGASGISVLTDRNFFGGSNEDLMNARQNHIPILRKEFIIHEYQISEARSIGADAILLIAACLRIEEVKRLARFARSLNLEVLLEVHDESELEHICDETELVGINNRNLKTFEVDIENALMLASKIPSNKIKIAESGIKSVEDLLLFKKNGYDGFLIGETFMKESDPGLAFEIFVNQLKKSYRPQAER